MLLEVAEETDYVDGKGCYPGQEVVARTLHRGHINRHLCTLSGLGQAPPVGCKLKQGEKEVGWVSSATAEGDHIWALAFLRREAWEPGTELEREDGGLLTVRSPRRED